MTEQTFHFNAKQGLGEPSADLAYLQSAFSSGEPAIIADAIMLIAEVRGLDGVTAEARRIRDEALPDLREREAGGGLRPRPILPFAKLTDLLEPLGLTLGPIRAEAA